MKSLDQSALQYHRLPKPGKLGMVSTKPLVNQRDLSLAYSPGVAAACLAIKKDPQEATNLTNRSNLVVVITNGTAVLGLGAIGPLAAKPVMEGKAVLFKHFAGIDSYDLAINETNVDKLADIIASLEYSFGAINLEDIKAPECFELEEKLKARMNIPVFHDDQHGTAIIAAAALCNGLEVTGKKISHVRIVTSGAGAAAIACIELFVSLGADPKNIVLIDRQGVIHKDRKDPLDPRKAKYADHPYRTLQEALKDADVFLGLSVGNVLKVADIKKMAPKPLIFALANPTPEIDPLEAKKHRPDAIIATGRSDHPNQVNNVLCFPFIFRGALDVGATEINEEMKKACVYALADLAKAETSEDVAEAYDGKELKFGNEYIIPKPFDPRLISHLAPAVAKAAMDSGVATKPIKDFQAYAQQLSGTVYMTTMTMRHVFSHAKKNPQTICFCGGEDKRVLRAVQIAVDEKYVHPILIGRPDVVLYRIRELGLRLKMDKDFVLVDPQSDPRFKEYWTLYYNLMKRKGVSPELAREHIRNRNTLIGAVMVKRGEVSGLIAGPVHHYNTHLNYLKNVIGLEKDCDLSTLNALVLEKKGVLFFMDAYVNEHPDLSHLANAVIRASEKVKYFGIEPRVGLLSHSNFGSHQTPTALKMSALRSLLAEKAPQLIVEGEMNGDTALDATIRNRIFPDTHLKHNANLFVMPNIDAANIAYTLMKSGAEGQPIGPMILGLSYPAYVVTPAITVRGILNMTALVVMEAKKTL